MASRVLSESGHRALPVILGVVTVVAILIVGILMLSYIQSAELSNPKDVIGMQLEQVEEQFGESFAASEHDKYFGKNWDRYIDVSNPGAFDSALFLQLNAEKTVTDAAIVSDD